MTRARPQWSTALAFACCIALVGPGSAAYAERLPLKIFTTADGLASNNVTKIVRDSRGFLWFCTADGLSRFDGYAFVNYTDEQGLPHRAVNDLLETRAHEYWVATDGGVVRFDPAGAPLAHVVLAGQRGGVERPMFITVPPDPANARARATNVLFEDRAGTIWVGTSNGLYRIETAAGASVARSVDIGIPNDYPAQAIVTDILETRDASLWIATENGLYRRSLEGTAARYTKRDGLPDDYLHDLVEDHAGRLWVGSRYGGLFHLVSSPGSNQPIIDGHYSVPDGQPWSWVFQIFEASDHHFWIGTANGLAEFQGSPGERAALRVYGTRHGLTFHDITAVNEDTAGNLWLGTNSAGAMKLARNGFVTYAQADGINAVNAIFEDRAGGLDFRGGIVLDAGHAPRGGAAGAEQGKSVFGRLAENRFDWFVPQTIGDIGWVMEGVTLQAHDGEWWLGTATGVYRFAAVSSFLQLRNARPLAHYSTADGLAAPQVFRLFEDSYGNVWISTTSAVKNGLARWNRATGRCEDLATAPGLPALVDDLPRAFGEDSSGGVWIGFGRGLARYRGGRFNFYSSADGLPPGAILDIHLDVSKRLWLASARSGLIEVVDADRETPQFVTYTTDKAVGGGRVEAIADDAYGRVYAATGRGIDRLDPATGHIRHFTTADGLAPGIIKVAYRDHAGVLWFGTTGGLSRLVPVPDAPVPPPPVFVTGVVVSGQRRPVSAIGERALSVPDLNASERDVQLEFVGLEFAPGQALRYEHQLEPAGTDWNVTDNRTVNFARLAPGRYHFRVRAINSDGAASTAPAVVSFRILPPVWQRWWFLCLAVTAICAGAWALYRYRMARIVELANMRARIALDLHDDIGSNLTKIAILSEVAQRQNPSAALAADHPLATIGQISRESIAGMGDIVWAINPQHDRLIDLVRRMRQHAEQVLAPADIKTAFRAPADGGQLKVGIDVRRAVFLMFKEAINNVARHTHSTRVDIDLHATGSSLSLTIADNGVGFEPSSPADGQGLAGMRRRAEQLGGCCDIRATAGRGTTIHIVVPTSGRVRATRTRR